MLPLLPLLLPPHTSDTPAVSTHCRLLVLPLEYEQHECGNDMIRAANANWAHILVYRTIRTVRPCSICDRRALTLFWVGTMGHARELQLCGGSGRTPERGSVHEHTTLLCRKRNTKPPSSESPNRHSRAKQKTRRERGKAKNTVAQQQQDGERNVAAATPQPALAMCALAHS